MKKWGQHGRLLGVLVILAGMTFIFAGCEKSPPPSPTIRTQRTRKAKTPPAKKVVPPKKERVFSYNPRGKVDPFKPFITIGSGGKSVKGVHRTPLQEYDLSQLKLTAIISTGGHDSRALVEDSAGKGFTLKKDTYIGKRGGRVKAIYIDRVIIEEPVRVFGKESKSREVVLKIPVEGGGK